ncbi:filamentous hemagglutinin N-terminal domain-containing protein [Leptolyngbya sp. NK1-12]|uniref:Filamentous hemagglutinin N-terminal domain-containing protein n=1 Tax=Leptolyngbya sp. NK1-12 TaxID=2547451 RepID=A0AA96WZ20_9CYAN|nr:filamentous hemagglutinin N-terminal domain-containing protein [Leptolyngbya sp. NK1-12]
MRHAKGWQLGLVCWSLVGVVALSDAVEAQVVPDNTLGAERSRVRADRVRGRDGVVRDSDVIEGGAQRGSNLFHSFEQFDVPEERGAYFDNPVDVQNIFSRVTGADRSEILGRLGVLGNANLFFMNPNGILFGPNVSLDVGGSFVGTTANAIQFGEQGFFSATNPEAPSLLTVNPSAFLFSQIGNGAIVSQARELAAAPGRNLLLVGGDIVLNGSTLFSSGGSVEMGGLAEVGTVQFATSSNIPQLEFPTGVARANVGLQNNSFIFTNAGGSVTVHAQNLELTNSSIFSSLFAEQGGRSGDLAIDLTGNLILDRSNIAQIGLANSFGDTDDLSINAQSVQLFNRSSIFNNSQRNAGSVYINAADKVTLDSSLISSTNSSSFTVRGSDTFITAQSIDLTNQSIIGSISVGQGSSGQVSLVAQGAITLAGGSAIQTSANPLIAGNISRASAGNINLQAQSLSLKEDSQIAATSLDAGRSGDVQINVREGITLNDSIITSDTRGIAEAGGNINIQSDWLSLLDASAISTLTANNSQTGTVGQGNAGNITIIAQRLSLTTGSRVVTDSTSSRGNAGNIVVRANDVEISGFITAEEFNSSNTPASRTDSVPGGLLLSSISSNVTNDDVMAVPVQGGTITIEANRLRLSNGGRVIANVQQARGQAGNIVIRATDSIEISGRPRPNNPSGLFSSLQTDGIGRGGSIQVTTDRLSLSNAGEITTATFSQGNAGNILIEAAEVDLRGLNTSISTRINETGRGDAGDLELRVRELQVQDNAQIDASTSGVGNGGNLIIYADEIALIDTPDPRDADTGLFTIVVRGAEGNAGNISVITNRLTMNNGAGLLSGTSGQGRAGNINIRAKEQISLDDDAVIASSVAAGAVGNGGSLSITTPALFLREDSDITTSTSGNGSAGDLTIRAEQINLQDAAISTGVAASGRGNAGNLAISTEGLRLRNATINSLSEGIGNAGNMMIRAEQIDLQGLSANITTQINSGGQGRGGNIDIRTRQLRVQDNAQISTGTLGIGDAGNLRIRARTIELVDTPDPTDRFTGLLTLVNEEGIGNAGNLVIDTNRLTIRNGATISSEVFGQGQGGDVQIRARDRININSFVPLTNGDINRSGVFTGTNGQGDAGNISIFSGNSITLRQQGLISSASQAGSVGDAGDINLQTDRLTILEGGSVLASVGSARRDAQGIPLTGGQGRGGDIQITASDGIRVSGIDRNGLSSIVSTSTGRGATGRAGTITLTTGNLEIDDGGIVTARTLNDSPAGNIVVNAETLTATDGGQVVTSTSGAGNAGAIRLNVTEEIRLSGTDVNFSDRLDRANRYINRLDQDDQINSFISNQGAASGLFANTSARSSGDGGSINLNTANLSLTDRATISARSQGAGIAGDINLHVDQALNANNSNITTSAQTSGGTINITASDIRLQNNSDITTSSGGDGGNITLQADSILVFDDSDILARSQDARGGNIILDTPAFFGETYQPDAATENNPDGNNRVDLDASGTVSSGTVQTPNTDFIQNSLSDLPTNAINTDQLLANSCIVRTESGGTFLITGTGGLPAAPGNDAASTYPTGEIRAIPAADAATDQTWQLDDPIAEPQGVYRLPDGRLVMSRECENQETQ